MTSPVRRYTPRIPEPSRPGRLRMALPTGALLLALAGLAAVWAVLAWRAGQELDAWLDREAALGRAWSCPQRSIAGFPFRIEVTCTDPTFTGAAEGQTVKGRLGKVHTVAQIYNPNHVIAEFEGPLVVETNAGERVEMNWTLGRASIHGKPGAGLERLSAEVTEPRLAVAGRTGAASFSAGLVDFHVRRTPNRPAEDGAYDVASRVERAVFPPLDTLLGQPAAANADLVATISKAEPLSGRGLVAELERWRAAGGRMQVSTAMLSHGPRRLDASGNVGLDEAHRPQGRLDVTLTGLDEVLQRLGLGGRSTAIGGLIAGVLGGRGQAAEPPAQGGATARGIDGQATKGVVLPLRMDGGRVFLGPLPLATLMPLY